MAKSTKSGNRKYEEWKVKPVYEKQRTGNDQSLRNVVVDFKKDAMEPIRTTTISPEKAEILNSQSENTLVRLYEVE